MITSFFLLVYILSSAIVVLLLSIALQGNLSAGYAWLFGIFVIPVSIFSGVVMITRSFLAKSYPSELVFELISLLVIFMIFTPLTSFAILARKDVHENNLYGIPFILCGCVSFIPGILKILLSIQKSTEVQIPTLEKSMFVAVALFVVTMIAMVFVPNE
ncbi:hypothetical protein [uncultured Cytophaga sp.]|uniref:hypothetical protein n=1 Tax=uncultured Cytophaga sp. TaxID=160238 RepID=UPI002624C573|nr:hypothetical protein [uncultured Cytophaga sp.]